MTATAAAPLLLQGYPSDKSNLEDDKRRALVQWLGIRDGYEMPECLMNRLACDNAPLTLLFVRAQWARLPVEFSDQKVIFVVKLGGKELKSNKFQVSPSPEGGSDVSFGSVFALPFNNPKQETMLKIKIRKAGGLTNKTVAKKTLKLQFPDGEGVIETEVPLMNVMNKSRRPSTGSGGGDPSQDGRRPSQTSDDGRRPSMASSCVSSQDDIIGYTAVNLEARIMLKGEITGMFTTWRPGGEDYSEPCPCGKCANATSMA